MFNVISRNEKLFKAVRNILRIAWLVLIGIAVYIVMEDKWYEMRYILFGSSIVIVILTIVVLSALPVLVKKRVILELNEIKAAIEKEHPGNNYNITVAHGIKYTYWVFLVTYRYFTAALIYNDTNFIVVPITDNKVGEPILLEYSYLDSSIVKLKKNYVSFKFPKSKVKIKSKEAKTAIFRSKFENNDDAYNKLRGYFKYL